MLRLYRGHAWLKNASDGAAWIGMDEFAHRLMGPISRFSLPGVGSVVREGQPALKLQIDGKDFEVLSPVDGNVTAINLEAVEKPEELGKDPYGKAWLFRVKPTGPSTSFSALFSGEKALAPRRRLRSPFPLSQHGWSPRTRRRSSGQWLRT